MCVAAGAVWVASTYDRGIVRFDPVSRRTTTIPPRRQPTQLACGGGSCGPASQSSGTVTQVSAAPRRVVRRIAVGRGASGARVGTRRAVGGQHRRRDGVAHRSAPRRADRGDPARRARRARRSVVAAPAASGSATSAAGTVARIDPARNAVVTAAEDRQPAAGPRRRRRSAVGERPRDPARSIAAGRCAILQSVTADGVRLPARLLDPAARLRRMVRPCPLTNDGLVAFRRVGGRRGDTLVPDLATSLPAPTDGGRTYAFRLRRGLRYSTGAAVRASDIRRGLERVLRKAVGHRGVLHRDPRRRRRAQRARGCDLSAGIEVDDAAGTITFRLDRGPTPTSSTSWRCPRRRGPSGRQPAARRGPPGHRPVHGRRARPAWAVRLVRNPRFRPVDGRPDGYPDEITIDCCADPREPIRAVQQGRADLVGGTSALDGALRPQLDAIVTRYAGQLHTTPVRPPLRVPEHARAAVQPPRRAPRAELRRRSPRRSSPSMAGTRFAQATCQFLPAQLPRLPALLPLHRPRRRRPAVERPDLARARRLIARSHTRGMRVTVVAGHPVIAGHARLIGSCSTELGYRATLRVLPRASTTSATSPTRVTGSRSATVVAPDYPRAPPTPSAARVRPRGPCR